MIIIVDSAIASAEPAIASAEPAIASWPQNGAFLYNIYMCKASPIKIYRMLFVFTLQIYNVFP